MPSNKCRESGKDKCIMRNPTGFCTALKDTDFGGKACPFFKPKSEKGISRNRTGKVARSHGLKFVKSWHKIPMFSLSMERIMQRAENQNDLITVEYENGHYNFIADKDEIMIISRYDGYIRIPQEEVKDLISELDDVIETVNIWKRQR